jgi:flavodoxin
MTKTLILFYSLTGKNKKLAEKLKEKIKADIGEIKDTDKRKGKWGFMKSGFQAAFKKTTKIRSPRKDLQGYNLIILISPIWAGNIVPALRTYIKENKKEIKKVAFASVSGKGDENEGVLGELNQLVGKKVSSSLLLSEQEFEDRSLNSALDQFVKNL